MDKIASTVEGEFSKTAAHTVVIVVHNILFYTQCDDLLG